MAVAVGQARMGDENIRNLHAFFTSKNGFNLVSNELQDRRKRQRTTSPVREPSISQNITQTSRLDEWKNQLRVAAYGVSPSDTSNIIPPHQDGKSVDEFSNGIVVNERQDHLILDRTLPVQRGACISKELFYTSNTSINHTASAHPKKMLQIRPDGKLVSPKARTVTNDLSFRKEKGGSKYQIPPSTRVVTIKYGLDDETRLAIARKIESICSNIPEKAKSTSKTHVKGSKPSEPPKPTHPFFLGSRAQVLDQATNIKEKLNESDTGDKQDRDARIQKQDFPRNVSANTNAWTGLIGAPRMTDHTRASRFPGAVEPVWPPQGMLHVRPATHFHLNVIENVPQTFSVPRGGRKLKYANLQVSERENVLRPYVRLAHKEIRKMQKSDYQRNLMFKRPKRKVMTGFELQTLVCDVVDPSLQYPKILEPAGKQQHPQICPALSRVFKDIPYSLTAFDKFECETQEWIHKYAPKRAEEVLQHGREALVLRDWLRGLAVCSVESGSNEISKKRDTSLAFKRLDGVSKRKKRKQSNELDGFIISDNDESDQMDELASSDANDTDAQCTVPPKKSIIRAGNIEEQVNGERAINALVISGPHGCGKTAAVYAVAHELDFEVFEINAGSRRSGREILDKVGDMTQNHLVNRQRDTEEAKILQDAVTFNPTDSEPSQDISNSFFRPQIGTRKEGKGRPKKQRGLRKAKDPLKKTTSQKQSVLLLEEVDVLFEEDKQFWPTIMDLILHSKRPIIMTCTDESLLPLQELHLFAILRFAPPPERLAIDYLLLVACNEGHLLTRQSISSLLRSKGYDLRASMMDLNFFCQMAVGDTKGGLEWMLIGSQYSRPNEPGETQRVVSENTYVESMNSLNGDQYDIQEEVDRPFKSRKGSDPCTAPPRESKESNLKMLEHFEKSFDAISAADIHPRCVFRDGNSAALDTTLPKLSEKSRTNYIEGPTLIEAEPVDDLTGLSAALTSTLNSLARRLCYKNEDTADNHSLKYPAIGTKSIIRTNLITATNPIARPLKPPTPIQKGPSISSFDGPTSTITQDLAPYLRTIIFSDIKIQEQRARLNNLLSQGRLQTGKKTRTTRASRAALEGGSKAQTRRERWFPGTSSSIFAPILQTGGEAWQELAWQRAQQDEVVDVASSSHEEGQDRSRQSSVTSVEEE